MVLHVTAISGNNRGKADLWGRIMHRKYSSVLPVAVSLLVSAGILRDDVTQAAPVAAVPQKEVAKPAVSSPSTIPAISRMPEVPRYGFIVDWGIWLRYLAGKLSVHSVVPNSMASHSKIAVGDEIVELDQLPIQNFNAAQVEIFLRGTTNTFTLVSGKRKLTFQGYFSSWFGSDVARYETTGTGHGYVGAGTGEGTAGVIAMGSIAPYRKQMLELIAQNWHPRRPTDLLVSLTIAHDGTLLAYEILQSSGNRKMDHQALEALQSTEFQPLPDWYKGEQLQFKVELSKVEALNYSEGYGYSQAFQRHRPPERGQQTQQPYFQTDEQITAIIRKKVKGNWQRNEGPVVQFKISTAPAQLSIARSSGQEKLDARALFVLNHLKYPTFPISQSKRPAILYTVNLGTNQDLDGDDIPILVPVN
jgi:TonB family protein